MKTPRAPLFLIALAGVSLLPAADESATLKQFCFQCHGKAAMGGLNLEKLTAVDSVGDSYQHWEKIAKVLEQKRMPPPKMPQPSEEQRVGAVSAIRTRLNDYAARHAGDPGRITMRRLTSGEYAYTIRDLTGLDFKMDKDFVADSVGGEGFTNFGDVQFMGDAILEIYLKTARRIADYAVIGSGPIEFYGDPGKTGFELSALNRIENIYRAYGFRASSAEGGLPYGMDRYAKAFAACWRYQHRAALGEPNATLESNAAREGQNAKFVKHLWTVMNQPAPTYPSSEIVALCKQLPVPTSANRDAAILSMLKGVTEMQSAIIEWPRMLFGAGAIAAGGQGDERSLVLSEETLKPKSSFKFKFALRKPKDKMARVYFSGLSVNPASKDRPLVAWRNSVVRFRKADRTLGEPQPLFPILDPETVKRLGLSDGGDIVSTGSLPTYVEIVTPKDIFGLDLQVEAVLIPQGDGDAVVRVGVSDTLDKGKGAPVSAILGDAKSPGYALWKSKVLEFAANLPQSTHREAAPADKDPIPLPYDNTYNQPERDAFHIKAKYYRGDNFLIEKMLDEATRVRLEHAWADLLSSFGYHDAILNFSAEKFKFDTKGKSIAELDKAFVDALPEEPRKYVSALRTQYDAIQKVERDAQPGHVEDCVRFAASAWRRPLTPAEKQNLRLFYNKMREVGKLDHSKAIRATLARILVAPAFLYRVEQPVDNAASNTTGKAVSDWELASRMSYFLWSSMPDGELRRAASAGELRNPQQLEAQVKRMLADPKARRLSAEFFGQWLGFYRFDQYAGVDTGRFPEFTEELKAGMYDEAVSFFEHIVRKDKPIRDVLFADYTFLNQPLAKYYGAKKEIASKNASELVEGANSFQRGGMLRLGAVLTVTSAPLRTSPVKRGDWVLRRVLGTPTPPPPADAGTLPSDDKAFGGLSVFEKLAAHRRNPTCDACHSRIDPLGFPLEHYDPIGRWRDGYQDGKPVHDSSTVAGGKEISGATGLLDYMKTQEPQILHTLAHKMLGYALGRTVQLSDQPLIDQLAKSGGEASFSKLASMIVSSPQFRNRRDTPDPKSLATGTPRKEGEE